MPVGEEPGILLSSSVHPGPRFERLPPQSLEFLHGPSDQVLVDAQCEEVQLGAVEEGGGEELPLPAPIKPDVSLSTHPAYYLGCSAKAPLCCQIGQAVQRGPGPSLQGHYSPFITTTPQSAPVHRIRYSRLRFSDLGVLPFPPSLMGPRHDWFPSSVQEPTPRSCPLYAGHRLAKSEMIPPGLSQGRASALVLMSSFYLSTRHRKVRFRSTPWCLPDRGSPAVSYNAQDPRS